MSEGAATTRAAELWQRHREELMSLALKLVRDRAEADDVVAETYEVLVQALPRRQAHLEERLLIFGVAANLARHRARSKQRLRRLREAVARDSLVQGGHPEDAHATVERKELISDLHWAMEQLGEEHRLVLRELVEGRSAAELARELGEAEGTIRSRAHHARRQLKGLLQQRWAVALVSLLLMVATAYAAVRIIEAVRRAWPKPPAAPAPRTATGPGLPQTKPPAEARPPIRPAASRDEHSTAAPPKTSPRSKVDEQPEAKTSEAARAPEPAPAFPNSAELYARANSAQFERADYSSAVNGWNAFLAQFSTSPLADDARFNRVTALFKLGRLEEAAVAAREAIRLQPDSPHRKELAALLTMIESAPAEK